MDRVIAMLRSALPPGILLLAALVAAVLAFDLGIGSLGSPGPGLLPFQAAVGLVLVSAALLMREIGAAIRSRAVPAGGPPVTKPEREPVARHKVALAILGMALFGTVLEPLGIVFAAPAFLLYLWVAVERQAPLRALLLTAVTAVLSDALFVRLLNVHFPRGLLGP